MILKACTDINGCEYYAPISYDLETPAGCIRPNPKPKPNPEPNPEPIPEPNPNSNPDPDLSSVLGTKLKMSMMILFLGGCGLFFYRSFSLS